MSTTSTPPFAGRIGADVRHGRVGAARSAGHAVRAQRRSALSLNSMKPKLGQFSSNVRVTAGNYDQLGIRGAINIPVTDTLAFRVAFVSDRRDGYADFQPAPDIAGINKSRLHHDGQKYYAADQQVRAACR